MAELSQDEVAVKKADLEKWLTAINELKQFKADAETDIGWVMTSFQKLVVDGSPMKMIGKLLMGKMELEEIIDPDRLKKIGEKYAPEAMKNLMESKTK